MLTRQMYRTLLLVICSTSTTLANTTDSSSHPTIITPPNEHSSSPTNLTSVRIPTIDKTHLQNATSTAVNATLEVTTLNHSQVRELSHSQVTELSHSQVTELSHSQVTELNHSLVTELSHSQVTELNHSLVTELNYSQVTELNHSQVTELNHSHVLPTPEEGVNILLKIHRTVTRSRDAVWATVTLTFICVLLLLAVAQSRMWKDHRLTESQGVPLPDFNERVLFRDVMEHKIKSLKRIFQKQKKKNTTEMESLLASSELDEEEDILYRRNF